MSSYIPSPQTGYSYSGTSAEYACPSIFAKDGSLNPPKKLEDSILGWMREAIDEGATYLKQCRAYKDIERAIDLITEQVQEDLPVTISHIFVPSIKRDIKEMVAILSNIRPSWLYETRSFKDEKWAQQARIQNGLSKDWYERNFIDREIKKLLQLGIVEGTGYISPIWNPHYYGPGRGSIELKNYRYDEVLPVQLPKDFNLQNAYAIIITDEMGINRARRTWPHKAHLIVPDRGQSRLGKGIIATAVRTFSEAIQSKDNPTRKMSSGPVVDIYYIYVDDFSINPLPSAYPMGESSWGYEVPYVGQQIRDGYNSDGSIKTLKATHQDCLLYPNRRLIIATATAVLYDGPSFWWHGRVPIIKYSPDDWIFSFLGFSMAAEVSSMQTAAISMRRALEDALHLTIDPPTAVDETMLSKTVAASTSLRTPGRKIRGKLAMGEFMKPIMNPAFYKPGAEHFGMVKEVEEKMKEILGLPDLKALQQAKQVPSSDSIEKFFSQAGAIVTDMSRSMDRPMYELADLNRYYFYQFYTLEDRIKIMGEDGITEEDFDFNPGTLIPASLEGEPRINPSTGARDEEKGVFLSSELERAKKHIRNFKTTIHPTSLHQITHMQRKLLYMQATKVNPLLVDPETLARMLDIENWGRLPGETVLEKVRSALEMQEQFGLKSKFDNAMLEMMIQKLAQSQSPEGQMSGAMEGLAGAIKGSPEMGGRGPGRPPEFQGSPQLVNKGDRTTITGSAS